MKCRPFNLLTTLSVSLFAATCALWVRSWFVGDRIAWGAARPMPAAAADYFNVRTFRGGLLVRWDRREFGAPQPADLVPPAATWERSEAVPLAALYPPQSAAERAGFRLERDSAYIGSIAEVRRHVAIAFPFWAAAAAFGVLPGAWGLRRRASRRRVWAGNCGACGYDLRATPDRCPECGTLAPQPLS